MSQCPKCGRGRGREIDGRPGEYYSDIILVEIRGLYDGGLFYMCPFCGHKWHRWGPDTYPRLWELAQPFVNDPTWGLRSDPEPPEAPQ